MGDPCSHNLPEKITSPLDPLWVHVSHTICPTTLSAADHVECMQLYHAIPHRRHETVALYRNLYEYNISMSCLWIAQSISIFSWFTVDPEVASQSFYSITQSLRGLDGICFSHLSTLFSSCTASFLMICLHKSMNTSSTFCLFLALVS